MKEDSKVSRSIFVKSWTKVENSTVTETYDTKGVTTAAEKYNVYFNGENQISRTFSRKRGRCVASGTPLYEYTVKNLEQQTVDLEREIAALESDIAGVDEYIEKLTDYPIQVPDDGTTSSSDINIATLDQEIYKQELGRKAN